MKRYFLVFFRKTLIFGILILLVSFFDLLVCLALSLSRDQRRNQKPVSCSPRAPRESDHRGSRKFDKRTKQKNFILFYLFTDFHRQITPAVSNSSPYFFHVVASSSPHNNAQKRHKQEKNHTKKCYLRRFLMLFVFLKIYSFMGVYINFVLFPCSYNNLIKLFETPRLTWRLSLSSVEMSQVSFDPSCSVSYDICTLMQASQ